MNRPIKTVAEFHERLKQLTPEGVAASGSNLLRDLLEKSESVHIYRGQSKDWLVDCSAARRLYPDSKKINPEDITYLLISYMKSLVDKARMRGFIPPGFSALPTDMEILAQLQHQGAATGLIDFTRHPLIALWFACGESTKKHGENGVVYLLPRSDIEEICELEKLQKTSISSIYQGNGLRSWEPAAVDNRIVTQRSVFVFGMPRIPSDKMETIIVCSSEKNRIRKELEDIYTINEEELFSDFSGYAKVNAVGNTLDLDRTSRYLEEQIKSASDDAEKASIHFTLGALYYGRDELEDAINHYTAAIKFNPDDARASKYLAKAKMRLAHPPGPPAESEGD